MVTDTEPRRSLSVRRVVQLTTGAVTLGVIVLAIVLWVVFLPRIGSLRSDTERLVGQIRAFADHAARLDSAVVIARREIVEGDVAGASETVRAARAETSTSLEASARDAMISAPLEMQTSLAIALDHESQIRDWLSEGGALLELGRTASAAEVLARADSLGTALAAALASAQQAGLVDVGRRSGELDRLAHDLSRVLLWLSVPGVVGMLLIARVVRQRLTLPLDRLDSGLRAVSAGDLTVSIDVNRDDETGRLGALFNRMALELRQREVERENERKEMTRRILDASLDAVVTIDPDGRITAWNPGAERIFGWSELEVTGRDLGELIFPPEEQERRHFGVVKDETGNEERVERSRVEVTALRKDGRAVSAELSVVPIVEGGQVVALASFIRDITETLELQEQVRRSQRLDAVGRLAGGIAHDFNNLMSVILGRTQLVLEQEVDDETREGLVEVERAAERATELTSQLLAFARKRIVAPKVVDVNDFVRQTLEMAGPAIEASVRVVPKLAPEVGQVSVDPGYFSQVLLNLLINARDAVTPGGGTVTVATDRVEVANGIGGLPISGGAYVAITVSDDGPGIGEEAAERLFEPFFSTKQKGTGLGLATCHGIVRQAGGAITALNLPEGGAQFSVYLPRVG